MILKLKAKSNKNKTVTAWIQKHKDFNDDVQQIFTFFKDKITFSKLSKITKYYVVTSTNPAIIFSLFSAVQDLIPEAYYSQLDSMDIE
ncbi:hypothetical protein LCGC14_1096060 [marine sediment metagenome]|uniref:Uncharacterized protein n=2 Tax=marine sediment metagenome TaxID=412755 RepID=A0A0F9H285_9ZZZZ